MKERGRGWHGERARHSAAARGIKTVKTKPERSTSRRNIETVVRAKNSMDRILKWRGSFIWRQPTLEEQDKLTKDLNDILYTLGTAHLPTPLTRDVEHATEEIEEAWAVPSEKDRILKLELARERLHYVITKYLIPFGKMDRPPATELMWQLDEDEDEEYEWWNA